MTTSEAVERLKKIMAGYERRLVRRGPDIEALRLAIACLLENTK